MRPMIALLVAVALCGCQRGSTKRSQGKTNSAQQKPTPDQEAWPCYAPELAKDPKLTGDVAVTFDIGPDGQVSSAKVLVSSLHNADVELCVVSLVNKWKLANPAGATVRGVRYTFHFAPPK